MNILIINNSIDNNNELNIATILEGKLKKEKYNIFKTENIKDGLTVFNKKHLRLLIIVDDILTTSNSIKLIEEIRETSNVPLIVISNKDNVEERLLAFDAGIDDYIFKPFYIREIMARIKVTLKRTETFYEDILTFNNKTLMLNPLNHEVFFFGEKVILTATEYKILLALAKAPKRIYPREQLYLLINSDENKSSNRVIDTHIKNLRNKFSKDNKNYKFITTVYGIGYKFEELLVSDNVKINDLTA